MSWWRRKPDLRMVGSVLFRGQWAARPQDFAHLAARGVTMGPAAREDGPGWEVTLSHPEWGEAALLWHPDLPLPPREVLGFDPRLSTEERELARQAGSAFGVRAAPAAGNVLVDRKVLLRFLHAVMGDDGLMAVDHASQAFWSRAALDDELVHDAELDIDAVYTIHYVRHEAAAGAATPGRAYWLHTHGLKEVGATDLDILDPCPDLAGHAHELVRALAFAAVEGRLTPGGAALRLARGIDVCAVPMRDFMARATASAPAGFAADLDEEHVEGHAVVCEPVRTGLFARLLGSAPRPNRALSGELGDEALIYFSNSATDLMARRARQTIPLLHELAAELAPLQAITLVKLGYPIDGTDDASQREHLWFEVHGFAGDSVDATLTNQPFNVARLQQGDRGTHPLELLSDWAIMTPAGRVDPRSTLVLRFLREHRDEVLAALAAANQQ